MPRRLLNLLTALSLLLCVAAGLAAVVGRRTGFRAGWGQQADWVKAGGEGWDCEQYSVQGLADRLMLVRTVEASHYPNNHENMVPLSTRRSAFVLTGNRPAEGFVPTASPTTYPLWHGFAWMDANVSLSSHSHFHFRALVVPPWLPIAIAAVLPAREVLRRVRRHASINRGMCSECGYDLRATPDRCPECGTARSNKGEAFSGRTCPPL